MYNSKNINSKFQGSVNKVHNPIYSIKMSKKIGSPNFLKYRIFNSQFLNSKLELSKSFYLSNKLSSNTSKNNLRFHYKNLHKKNSSGFEYKNQSDTLKQNENRKRGNVQKQKQLQTTFNQKQKNLNILNICDKNKSFSDLENTLNKTNSRDLDIANESSIFVTNLLLRVNEEIVKIKECQGQNNHEQKSKVERKIKELVLNQFCKQNLFPVEEIGHFIKNLINKSIESEIHEDRTSKMNKINFLKDEIQVKNDEIEKLNEKVKAISYQNEKLQKDFESQSLQLKNIDDNYIKITHENKIIKEEEAKKDKEYEEAAQYFADIYNDNVTLKEYGENAVKEFNALKSRYLSLIRIIKGTTIKSEEGLGCEIIFEKAERKTKKKDSVEVGTKKVKIPSLDLSKVKPSKPGTFALIKGEKIPIEVSLSKSSSESCSDNNNIFRTFKKSKKEFEDSKSGKEDKKNCESKNQNEIIKAIVNKEEFN